MGWDARKIYTTRKDAENGAMLDLFIVVEMLRFFFYLWFVVIILVGLVITLAAVEIDYTAVLKSLGGAAGVCAFFDFPPATYVLPSMYALFPIITALYSAASILRAWIAKLDKGNNISDCSFILYALVFVYFCLSSLIFATIFAVQPDVNNWKKLQTTYILHTAPFTNFIVAITLLQIATAWFGHKVSYKILQENVANTKILKFKHFFWVIILSVTSILKLFQHVNSFGGLDQSATDGKVISNGWMWKVETPILLVVFQINDAIWMISALVVPMCISGYKTMNRFHTSGLLITLKSHTGGINGSMKNSIGDTLSVHTVEENFEFKTEPIANTNSDKTSFDKIDGQNIVLS